MGISRSSFYHKSANSSPDSIATQVELRAEIEAICAEWPRYGYRRVTKELQAKDWTVNHKRVARIMREEALTVRRIRRFVKTTDSDHDEPIYPNRALGFEPHWARSIVAFGHHVHPYPDRLGLPGGDPRRVVSQSRWLRDLSQHRHRADARCAQTQCG